MSKSLLVVEIAARIKGDDATAKAAKIGRKCNSAINSQIAALQAKEVDQEDAVDTAQEALNDAKYPTDTFTSGQNYIQGITDAEERLEAAREALDDTKSSIRYFKDLSKGFAKEVADKAKA